MLKLKVKMHGRYINLIIRYIHNFVEYPRDGNTYTYLINNLLIDTGPKKYIKLFAENVIQSCMRYNSSRIREIFDDIHNASMVISFDFDLVVNIFYQLVLEHYPDYKFIIHNENLDYIKFYSERKIITLPKYLQDFSYDIQTKYVLYPVPIKYPELIPYMYVDQDRHILDKFTLIVIYNIYLVDSHTLYFINEILAYKKILDIIVDMVVKKKIFLPQCANNKIYIQMLNQRLRLEKYNN